MINDPDTDIGDIIENNIIDNNDSEVDNDDTNCEAVLMSFFSKDPSAVSPLVTEESNNNELTYDNTIETAAIVPLIESEPICIEHRTFSELKEMFLTHISTLSNQCMVFSGLNKYSRRVLYIECQRLKLYHWSKQTEGENHNVNVSDRQEDEWIFI